VRAVIDIGSNSVLLLLASRGPGGELEIVHDEARVARLSQGAAERGSLDAEAIARTLAVIEGYVAIARDHGIEREAIVVVATEGLRMVDNPQDFLEPAAALLGRPVRLLSGDEEAQLSYRSVALEQPEHSNQSVQAELRVLDIGGASTELAVGRGLELLDSHSHRVGSVRLSERFLVEHPPGPDALAEMEASVCAALASQPLEPLAELHGLAGTVTTCASLLLGLTRYQRDRIDRSRFATHRIRALRDELATWPLARLQAEPMLGVGRADLVVAGATILAVTLEHCGADTLVVRDRGLRYALV
jgi:exopolyphosphatase/guanosine-5'-triphosphate,3'-diphosphate pyrophosphatase